MSQERPFGNSGAEHRPKPNHSQPTEEVTAAAPTPNHFWRMMIDPGFPSPASNLALFVVTAEAFLDVTNQVQALVGMVQTIVSYLPQLIHSRQVTEAHAASQTPAPARSQSRSCDLVQIGPDFDTLSSDTADCQREQVRQVHQRFDEVQKEVLKSREEIGESSKGSSSFTPEIQGKPLPATFKLPTLEPYDGSDDPTKHIAAFRAQMALYDTSDALMCRAFPTMLRGPARTCPEDATHRHRRGGRTEIFFQIREKGLLKAPNPMKSHFKRRDKRRYYCFHREYDHDMEKCRDLQYQIENLIRRVHLRRYVRDQFSLPDGRPPQDSSPRPKGPVDKQIDVIFEGPASGGDSSSARKAYARSEVGKRPLPSAYNAIIGRPTLNRLKAAVSTYHQLLKFPTRAGVGEVRSDPRESRQCYLTTTILSKKPNV
ncbi:hypothetical protein B296_00011349 [Ensete ventricosum]|uniref:Uncharacterized protein n=1 Tax=Ensete ventricosum TaxID=4639 RepID=A0A427A986_ENSVE|nr:hypothetical protein B296_00011349 [Ensete ventricosum]